MKNLILYIALAASVTLMGCGGGNESDDTVVCKDGWVSHSKDKQGACSSHGGVR